MNHVTYIAIAKQFQHFTKIQQCRAKHDNRMLNIQHTTLRSSDIVWKISAFNHGGGNF